jgi:nucleotide-binding universal stress UspA family protein
MTKGASVLERIVVGYAGDRAGREAVTFAGVLAAAVDGRLTIAFPYHPLLASRAAEEIQRQIGAEVDGLLARAAQSVPGVAALPTPTLHWTPSPWPIHALHELAAYEQAQLLVFGAAKEGLADHLHVSLMERMVHGAPCALALVPAGYEPRTLKRIGVGFAVSREGRAAVALGRALAERTDGQVSLIAGAGLEPALASYAFSSPALVDVEEEIYSQTQHTLERFCAELREGPAVQRQIIRGDPASVLAQRSSQLDLLVLGSRAYGPLRHALLGSVSARVMREARCPVLVMPRGVAGDDERDDERQPARAAQRD